MRSIHTQTQNPWNSNLAKTKKDNTAGMRLPGSIAKTKENKRM
jgi:hypothetical protein